MVQSQLCGCSGKMLRIKLATGESSIEPTARCAREWLGASGLAQWLLYNEVKPSVGALDPENLSSLDEAVLEREVTGLYKSLRGCRDTIASFTAKLKQVNEYIGGCLILPERHRQGNQGR